MLDEFDKVFHVKSNRLKFLVSLVNDFFFFFKLCFQSFQKPWVGIQDFSNVLLFDDDDSVVGRGAFSVVNTFLFAKNNFFFTHGLADTADNCTNSELFKFEGFGNVVLGSILEIDSYSFLFTDVFLLHEFFFQLASGFTFLFVFHEFSKLKLSLLNEVNFFRQGTLLVKVLAVGESSLFIELCHVHKVYKLKILKKLVLAHCLDSLAHHSLGHCGWQNSWSFFIIGRSCLENYFILCDSDALFTLSQSFYYLLTFTCIHKSLFPHSIKLPLLQSFLKSIIKIFHLSNHLQKFIRALQFMIQIKGTNINNIECYLLTIRKKSFLFFSKPNLSNLKHFVNFINNSQPKQTNENKIQQEPKLSQNENPNDFSKLKVHLDINYIKQICKSIQKHPDQPLLHLMITDYHDFLILPYIYRKFKAQQEIKVFCTHIAYEMGRICLKRFFDRVFHFDLLYSDPQALTYDQQSKLQDQFYVQYGVEIKTWVKLFSKEEMIQSLKLVNKMNYGEIHDSDGVKLRPFPSGHSLGSSFWMFENTLTRETIMFIRQISNQGWRSIAQNHLIPSQKQSGFKQKDYQNVDLLILANSSLVTQSNEKPETQILKFIKGIAQNMEKGINTQVILEDELIILDIIDFISYEMKDKFRGIFVENPEFNQIVSYANSYVEFLSSQYKNKIFQDPPQYPFENYLILKQKGFLAVGSLYETCQRQKVPLRQLMRRSSPYIHFKSDFDAYLSGLKDEEIKVYTQKDCMTEKDLAQLLTSINPKKIISYKNIMPYLDTKWSQNTAILNYSKQFIINSQPYHHYISKNISPNIINKYEFVEGFLMAYPVNREFLRFNADWKEEIGRHLKNNFIPVLEVNDSGIKTKYTHMWIQEYEIFIKSSHLRQVEFLLQVISQITKTLKLK